MSSKLKIQPKTGLEHKNPGDDSSSELGTSKTPKIFFGLMVDSYYTRKSSDSELFLSYKEFNERLHGSKSLNKELLKLNNLNDKNKLVMFSENFINAILNAKDRIWIIDGYLHWADEEDKNNTKLRALIELIHIKIEQIKQVRFYFKQDMNKASVEEILIKVNHVLQKEYNKIIDYRFFSYENIHDRFAIIDDVLWHFGSDVGATNPALNATSYGWDANYLKAIEFFDEFWSAEYEK